MRLADTEEVVPSIPTNSRQGRFPTPTSSKALEHMLVTAASAGYGEIVRRLLKRGVSPNATAGTPDVEDHPVTALSVARCGSATMKSLLDAGATARQAARSVYGGQAGRQHRR